MSWLEILWYPVGWLIYMLTIPRWAYRDPEFFQGEWKFKPEVHPGRACAEMMVMVSPFWFGVLPGTLWVKYRGRFGEICWSLVEAICSFGIWLFVPEYRKGKECKPTQQQ